jgi:hypothetical protein
MLQTIWYVGCCTAEYVVDILLSMHAADVTCRRFRLVHRVVVVYIVGFSKLSTVHSLDDSAWLYRIAHAVSYPLTIVVPYLVPRLRFGINTCFICLTSRGRQRSYMPQLWVSHW